MHFTYEYCDGGCDYCKCGSVLRGYQEAKCTILHKPRLFILGSSLQKYQSLGGSHRGLLRSGLTYLMRCPGRRGFRADASSSRRDLRRRIIAGSGLVAVPPVLQPGCAVAALLLRITTDVRYQTDSFFKNGDLTAGCLVRGFLSA